MVYDVAIIGSGPAGLTAGIYASRAKLNTVLLEGPLPGGQLTTTSKVENWPGNISILGPDLMIQIRNHTEYSGCKIISTQVIKVDFEKQPYTLYLENEKTLQANSIIIATGASHRKLNCPGEKEYWSKGVSVCATCDAPLYKDKNVVVVGGGDSAVTEAEHLSHYAKKVTIIHILDALTAKDPIKNKILTNPKVEFIYNSTVKEIKGDNNKVTSIVIENQKDKTLNTINTDGVFISIGMMPNTSIFKDKIELDKSGYIIVKNHTKTDKEGIFATGDVADSRYRQAITAASGGCMAALDCQFYLSKKNL